MVSDVDERRRCAWCRAELSPTAARNARFCSKRCRQTAFRLRLAGVRTAASDRPMAFAYADPPYVGLSRKYYRDEPTYAGEVDHRALVSGLEERRRGEQLDGWALSGSARSLPFLLSLAPAEHRVCSWVKPHPVSLATSGPHNVWEALIVVGGRARRPGVPDALVAHAARGGGTLPGRKPLAFWVWLFNLLGMLPGDTFDDMFPGTGTGAAAWLELSSGAGSQRRPRTAVSLLQERRGVAEDLGDGVSPAPGSDAVSLGAQGDGT